MVARIPIGTTPMPNINKPMNTAVGPHALNVYRSPSIHKVIPQIWDAMCNPTLAISLVSLGIANGRATKMTKTSVMTLREANQGRSFVLTQAAPRKNNATRKNIAMSITQPNMVPLSISMTS
jgi:hypothetical protein